MKERFRQYALRMLQLVRNELRANTSPFKASLSLAVGILIGFSPFYGLHYLLVIPAAFLFRLNRPLTLLAVSTTILPVVPLWVAAGFFLGNVTVSPEQANHIIGTCARALPDHFLHGTIGPLAAFGKRFIPGDVFRFVVGDSGVTLAARVVQWFIGCSVLSVVCSIGTFAIAFPVFNRFGATLHHRREIREKGAK